MKFFEEKILPKLGLINPPKIAIDFKQKELDKFLVEFQNVSTIWKIFLLHIIKPDKYPIFDQHVYRAFSYIKDFYAKELPNNDQEKLERYFKGYLPFFKEIQGQRSIKELDESMWSFGKFLKSNFGKTILKYENRK